MASAFYVKLPRCIDMGKEKASGTRQTMTAIFDKQQALENTAGNAELAQELFAMLLDELPVLQEELKQALRANDKQALWDHAHKIHGATAYCGVPALKAAASALEQVIKQDHEALFKEFVDRLNDELDRLLKEGTGILQQLA